MKLTQINRENNNVLYTGTKENGGHPHLIRTFGIASFDEEFGRWIFNPKGIVGKDGKLLAFDKLKISYSHSPKDKYFDKYFVRYENLKFPTSGM